MATIIYDLTVKFCNRLIDKKSRTHDQMVQAARSGKQNIAEGYTFQSLQGYIKLVGVAQGSLKELAADYEDYLRQRNLYIWPKDDPNLPNTPNLPNSPQEAANMLLTFCQMETFLLQKQLESLKNKFVNEGGVRENLFKKRMEYRRTL